MKKSLPLLVLILAGASTYAQSNFQEGYIITQQGDTLRGQIDNQDWRHTPKEILFKSRVGSQELIGPLDLREFYIQSTNEHYLAQIISIDAVPYRLDELMEVQNRAEISQKVTYQTKAVFLRALLTNSPVQLFIYQEANDKEHFFIQKESKLQELIFQKFLVRNDKEQTLIVNEQYKDQLSLLLTDCPEVRERIKKVRYEQSELVRLFELYSRCRGFSSIQSTRERGKWKIEAGLSLEQTRLRFIGAGNAPYLSLSNWPDGFFPSGGAAITYYLPRARNQLGFRAETFFRRYEKKSSVVINDGTFLSKYDLKFILSYVRLNVLLRYTYPQSIVRPFVGIGIANGYLVSITNHKRVSNPFRQFDDLALSSIRKHEQGILFEAGLTYEKLNGNFRFEIPNGFSNILTITSRVRIASVFLSYYLN